MPEARCCGACGHFEMPVAPLVNVGRCLWALRAARPPWSNRPAWAYMGMAAGADCPTWTPRPRRIRLSRARGFRLHAASHALNGLECRRVDRASAFGNPFRHVADEGCVVITSDEEGAHAAALVRSFRDWLGAPEGAALRARAAAELRGHNLACWCRLDRPCHADVLLEVANA